MKLYFATALAAAAATSIFATAAAAQPSPASLSSAEIAAKAAVTPPFSQERNAAAAYVAAQTFYIGRMALTCKPLLEQADSFPSDMVAKWRTENVQYARATAIYLSDLLRSIPDPKGARALSAHINDTVQRDGQKAVNDSMMGTDEERKTACMKFVINFADYRYNITEKSPFFATLQELVSDYGR
jgi:hypothetical protein